MQLVGSKTNTVVLGRRGEPQESTTSSITENCRVWPKRMEITDTLSLVPPTTSFIHFIWL